jgi:hypothetical protein
MPRTAYFGLLNLLDESHAAKVLLHAKRITPAMISVLQKLDPILRQAKFITITKRMMSVEAIEYYVNAVLRFCPNTNRQSVLHTLASIDKPGSIENWFAHWLSKAVLPPPPWTGNDRIQPISTITDMKAAAAEFRNCLNNRIASAVFNEKYYYVYRDGRDPIGVIELSNDRLAGWVISEIKGQDNRKLPSAVRSKIINEFAAIGIRQLPRFDVLPESFSPDFWDDACLN